jgi:hypothetical protein
MVAAINRPVDHVQQRGCLAVTIVDLGMSIVPCFDGAASDTPPAGWSSRCAAVPPTSSVSANLSTYPISAFSKGGAHTDGSPHTKVPPRPLLSCRTERVLMLKIASLRIVFTRKAVGTGSITRIAAGSAL